MPAKGTKKKNPVKPVASTHLKLPYELYDEIERLAIVHGLINPRNGKGNKTKLIEMTVLAFKIFGRSYPDNMPYPQALIFEMELAVAEGDTRWEKHLDYLYSWSAEHDLTEHVSAEVIQVKSDSGSTTYIV